ncbi:MAG: hypothetical protein ACI9UR_000173 [Bacteroidia bacterium]|jgi:hypothetical protein
MLLPILSFLDMVLVGDGFHAGIFLSFLVFWLAAYYLRRSYLWNKNDLG